MESHLHEWLHLLLRWIHFIVGVAWIGASFYFNWLENNLDRATHEDAAHEDGAHEDEKIAGDLWAIHGGGFYHLRKFKTGPTQLPAVLHWFKWEAYATWLSGFALLVLVYYFNAHLFLLPSASGLTPEKAVALGVVAVIGSWFVYDGLCRSPLRHSTVLLGGCVFGYLVILAWLLASVFSGRAAYIHIGAAMGTMMVGNVFFGIIPAQKEMVAALTEHRRVDPAHGANGLLRSRHNNYLTLPVLFIMISGHFPSTYGHGWSWAVLAVIAVVGWLVRHYFNLRQGWKMAGALPLALLLMLGLAWMTAPQRSEIPSTTQLNARPSNSPQEPVPTATIAPIIRARCAGCHAPTPTQPGFSAPPAGLVLHTPAAMERNGARIYTAAVVTKTMPLGNLTGMTDGERKSIATWYYALTRKTSTEATQ